MSGHIRVAAVGVGYWGKNLARNFAQMGNLAAVADFHPPTAERIAREHQCSVRTFDEIIADPGIHAIALATPARTHANLAIRALEAGKHVLVEKPLALDREDAERVVQASDRAGRVLMVGHLLQYHPIFVRLLELVRAGELGSLRYLYSNRLSLGKFRTEENVLWSFAPHDFSMLLALAGEAPVAVSAHGASYLTPGIADWCTAHLTFATGVRGHVQASWSNPFKEHRLVVVGDSGMAVFEDSQADWSKRLAIYRHSIDRSGAVPVPIKADPEFVDVAIGEPLRNECEHFIACIVKGTRPRTDGREGMRVLDVLQRAEAGLVTSLVGAKA